MSKHQEYLLNAEHCCEMAAVGGNDKHCQTLLAMARTWRELAAEEERIADLVRAVDELFPLNAKKTKMEARRIPKSLVQRLEESLLGKRLLRKPVTSNSRSPAPFFPMDEDAEHLPRWISKRIFAVQKTSE